MYGNGGRGFTKVANPSNSNFAILCTRQGQTTISVVEGRHCRSNVRNSMQNQKAEWDDRFQKRDRSCEVGFIIRSSRV